MTTLYIAEFEAIYVRPASGAMAGHCPPLAEQTLSNTGGSTASAAFTQQTHLIRVHTDSICSVRIGGTSPVATTVNMRLAAGQTEYFVVVPGDKLAVILNT